MEPLVIGYLVLYGVAAALFLGFHAGFGAAAARGARYVMLAAWLLQLADIGVRCFRGQHPLSSTAEALVFIAWLVSTGFLVATLRYRLQAAGAFALPVVLALLLLARIAPDERPETPLGSPLATVHILLATVGVATFALAAVLAVVYLLQERRLKRKKFDQVMKTDTAPLDTLDRLAAACVSFGFPVFTLTIVTGRGLDREARSAAHRGGGAAGIPADRHRLGGAGWPAGGPGGERLARAAGGAVDGGRIFGDGARAGGVLPATHRLRAGHGAVRHRALPSNGAGGGAGAAGHRARRAGGLPQAHGGAGGHARGGDRLHLQPGGDLRRLRRLRRGDEQRAGAAGRAAARGGGAGGPGGAGHPGPAPLRA